MQKGSALDDRIREALRAVELEPEELEHVIGGGFDFVEWAREEFQEQAIAELSARASDSLSLRRN